MDEKYISEQKDHNYWVVHGNSGVLAHFRHISDARWFCVSDELRKFSKLMRRQGFHVEMGEDEKAAAIVGKDVPRLLAEITRKLISHRSTLRLPPTHT